jgi:hypothetical protein
MTLGIGVMISELSGGNRNHPNKYIGKKITNATYDDHYFELEFEGGQKIHIVDDGQSCCEYRYITCDDDLDDLIGYALLGIEEKPGPEYDEDYDVHETMFVEIMSSGGGVTFTTHNEHNGYYGGFALKIEEVA